MSTDERKIRCRSFEETRTLAREFAALLASDPRCLVLLDGEMGAGKTQFTRFLLQAISERSAVDPRDHLPSQASGSAGGTTMGEERAEVTSPSFAIHNTYETSRGEVHHVDLYRVTDEDDLESTGFWDLFLDAKGLILVEWASRLNEMSLESHLPRTWPTYHLRFLAVGDQEREVTIKRL